MINMISRAQDGKAVTLKKTFWRSTDVNIDIHADKSIIWALLTNATDYPRWNSTVLSIDGEIQLKRKLRLKSYFDPNRTFKIKVREIKPESHMVWGDGLGRRTFILTEKDDGRVNFRMFEKIGSIMFPLFAGKIPSFDESFEKFAADLKKESELIQQSK